MPPGLNVIDFSMDFLGDVHNSNLSECEGWLEIINARKELLQGIAIGYDSVESSVNSLNHA